MGDTATFDFDDFISADDVTVSVLETSPVIRDIETTSEVTKEYNFDIKLRKSIRIKGGVFSITYDITFGESDKLLIVNSDLDVELGIYSNDSEIIDIQDIKELLV